MLYVLFPIIFLVIVVFILSYYIYNNNKLIKDIENEQNFYEIRTKNLIDAVNYNNDILIKENDYITQVYRDNDEFNIISTNSNIQPSDSNVISIEYDKLEYTNMMTNYDAIAYLI
jgi:hypothetical protein